MIKVRSRARARGEFPRLNVSADTRAAFNDLLGEAPKLGLDPERVEAAGLPGLRALLALKQAAESGSARKRDAHLRQLQNTMRLLQYRKHPELVQQLQARAMALQGRGGDTEVAHVTVGEIVLPKALQTRAVIEALGRAAGEAGIPLNRLRVGSGRNSINPRTGQPEFFDDADEDSPEGPSPEEPSSKESSETSSSAAPMEEIIVTAPRLPAPTNPPHVNAFFDANRDRITSMANEMGVPPNFLLGLAAGESDWWRPKGQNNIFGMSDSKGHPLDYPTPEAAMDAFRGSQWYSRLQGKTNEADFLNELQSTQNGKHRYNSERGGPGGPDYAPWIHTMIDTVSRRLPIWEQER